MTSSTPSPPPSQLFVFYFGGQRFVLENRNGCVGGISGYGCGVGGSSGGGAVGVGVVMVIMVVVVWWCWK